MPRVSKLLSTGSWIFDNAINGTPWTTIYHHIGQILAPEVIQTSGYRLIGNFRHDQVLRIPAQETGSSRSNNKDYQKDLSLLREKLRGPHSAPFFLVTHIRYPHYPRVDIYNADSAWDRFLSPSEKTRVQEYLRNPNRYPHKAPMIMALKADPSPARIHLRVQADPNLRRATDESLMGLINDEFLLAEWRRDPEFNDDMEILKKIYDANLAYMDVFLTDLLDLFGDRKLQENTVVIFMGDHGELHGEHGHFMHATSLYDESVRIPLVIRPADANRFPSQRVAQQIDITGVGKLIHQLLTGQGPVAKLIPKAGDSQPEAILLRDCAGYQRGLRFANHWKYIRDLRTGESLLFNLRRDPLEHRNLAPIRPDLIVKLEIEYWRGYTRFTHRTVAACAPHSIME
ncbi:MAG: sulfatase-like hydrolase/transferase [Bdellovibrionales bacterium]